MSPARRGLLVAVGGAAVAAPALANTQRIGRVEAIVRRLPILEQAMQAAEDVWMGCEGLAAEKDRLRSLWSEAAIAFLSAEDAALGMEPETVMDALLVIALASKHASRAADFDLKYGGTARELKNAARYSRRAAEFIAAGMGRDLDAVKNSECWQQQGNGT